jgi:hypothetical protein
MVQAPMLTELHLYLKTRAGHMGLMCTLSNMASGVVPVIRVQEYESLPPFLNVYFLFPYSWLLGKTIAYYV